MGRGAIGAVDDHLCTGRRKVARLSAKMIEVSLTKFPTSAGLERNGLDLRLTGGVDVLLYKAFCCFFQLLAGRGEDLNAVVLVRVVRGTDDYSRVELKGPRKVSDAGRGDDPR